uniref:Uncharacterized protein n=1 Tax=Oryza barthii TaxID=65489 RepID=A0A0D3F450_9ORYZ
MSSSWFHSSSSSSSSSSTHHHHRHVVHHASAYFDGDDDEGDVKPAVTQHWRYDARAAASYGGGEDVKPAVVVKQPPLPRPRGRKLHGVRRWRPGRRGRCWAMASAPAVACFELQAKDKALAKAQGEISRLKAQLGSAKARELEEARQALEYERKLGTQVLKSDGAAAGASKRRRGGQ